MKATWVKKFGRSLLLAGLAAAGVGLVSCADEYAAYPRYYNGGYYASYSAPYPYYGAYGYPYRPYGPYYGGEYYGYGGPYYGGGAVVVSGSRSYVSGNHTHVYRDRYGRVHRTNAVNGTRQTTRTTTRNRTQTKRVPQYRSDDERRYYTPQ